MLDVIKKIHLQVTWDKSNNRNQSFANSLLLCIGKLKRIKAIKAVYERYIRVTFISLITLFLNYTEWEKKHKQLIMVDYTHFVFGQQ